ncbi:hypothetical protein AAG570_008582 [Ranatra chinensis]|uniref:Uncharacterized protein n=1 Tax=Ranatra chinensis TaxID=642074 RepID=A0ABD0YRC1_9HEMI
MASKRRNMFYQNKKQETTEIGKEQPRCNRSGIGGGVRNVMRQWGHIAGANPAEERTVTAHGASQWASWRGSNDMGPLSAKLGSRVHAVALTSAALRNRKSRIVILVRSAEPSGVEAARDRRHFTASRVGNQGERRTGKLLDSMKMPPQGRSSFHICDILDLNDPAKHPQPEQLPSHAGVEMTNLQQLGQPSLLYAGSHIHQHPTATELLHHHWTSSLPEFRSRKQELFQYAFTARGGAVLLTAENNISGYRIETSDINRRFKMTIFPEQVCR